VNPATIAGQSQELPVSGIARRLRLSKQAQWAGSHDPAHAHLFVLKPTLPPSNPFRNRGERVWACG